jgi:hypothetical protein
MCACRHPPPRSLPICTCSPVDCLDRSFSAIRVPRRLSVYMERCMLDPKKRNAHSTTAHPEITHLQHVEMADRALAKNSLVHGCQTLDDVAPVNNTFSGKVFGPGLNVGTICFPSKGTDAEGDCQIWCLFGSPQASNPLLLLARRPRRNGPDWCLN